jgi:hypothetical protein
MTHWKTVMRSTRHILVINGIKVRRPVFLLGAPHSGTDLVTRALKQSIGFHLTMGRPCVLRVTYAFARRPSIATEQGNGAARVLRDVYARAWQITPENCAECPPPCRELAGVSEGACTQPRTVNRFADATPDLIYSADVLLDAFPDAQLIQVIRDGRDVVTGMLDDELCQAFFKPGFANLDEVFPNPFLGVEDATERSRWPKASRTVKCALRWRGSVRLSAKLHAQAPADQLLTIRYEDMVTRPADAAAQLSAFVGGPVSKVALLAGADDRGVGVWRDRLTAKQLTQVEKIAGTELRRLGYPDTRQ